MSYSPGVKLSSIATSIPALAVSVFLAFLPFLRKIDLDYDRLAPLLLLPAFWFGRGLWRRKLPISSAEAIDRVLVVVVAATALVASLGSAHQARALVQLASCSWIFAGALLVRRLATDPNALRILLIGIVAGSTVGCLVVWSLWTDKHGLASFPWYSHGRLFGLHMMIGMLSGLVLTLQLQGHRLGRLAVGLATTLCAGGMLWSGGRAPLLSAAIALLAWFWGSRGSKRRSLVRSAAWILAGGLLLSLVQWSPQPFLGWWSAIERSAAAQSVNELSSTRLDFWQTTWKEVLHAPWLGHGADSYRFITPKLDGDQPHNWILQFLLDFGVIGATALGALLIRQAWRGLRAPSGEKAHDARRGVAAAFVGCLTAGLLDGVFYHAVLLLPAAMLGAIAGSTVTAASLGTVASAPLLSNPIWKRIVSVSRVWLVLCIAILALHSYLYVQLTRRPVPASPTATTAQILHAFPSTTFGLQRWLDAWREHHPESTLSWARWAQTHSDTPAVFHLYAAIMLADRDDFASADHEMELAVKSCHWSQRANLETFRASIRAAQTSAASTELEK